jgi:hypothetical protein
MGLVRPCGVKKGFIFGDRDRDADALLVGSGPGGLERPPISKAGVDGEDAWRLSASSRVKAV